MAEASEPTTKESDGPEPTAAPGPRRSPINPPVFIGSAAVIVGFVAWAMIFPSQAETVIFGSMAWVAEHFGWYYVLTAGIVVVFVLVVATSKVGQVKLGPDHSKPRFNLFTWAAMLFAAGIGVDLMFFGISGPATNFLTPPDVAELSDEAARMAPIWTIFHYGIPGWAMYALMGMAFGLFAYRYHLPLSIRSALAPIVGRRIHGGVGHTVEIAATIGTIFGISVSLGIGVVFLNYGLSTIFDIPQSTAVQVALMAVAVFIAILSTVSGVEKGIRRLSELNVVLAVVLMLWVVLSGQTTHMLNALVQNIGDFFSRFPSMMLNTFAYTEGAEGYPSDQWMADWTLFFWAWWIAWAPFVSLFLARISRGRTLRQFVFGVLLIPFTFILLWISIFGNGALTFFRAGEEAFLTEAVEAPESGFYTLLLQYPGATFTVSLAVITGMLFYVTSADSGALVMANMTSKPSTTDSDGPSWLRIVWAVLTGALTLAMLFIDGVYTLQAATVMVGLPLSVVVYLIMFGLWKVLRAERLNMESHDAVLPTLLSGRMPEPGDRGSWRQRLARHMEFPSAARVKTFVEEVAAPALDEVAAELQAQGADVSCSHGHAPESGIPTADLHVHFHETTEFKYQVYPVAYSPPSFAANLGTVGDVYYRVEIFSATGSRGHDIMGYTKEQIIADILDNYEHHLRFLAMSGKDGAALGDEAEVPDEWHDADVVEKKS
ncbi:choline BCCT transporter BetT [Nesterenkonia marinintestina]|uniref:choline BCCT transporter BetT n=1 Tax=Nesterenkonia marinintestina TaxID=2979865 RepID=UPI0021BFEFF8|nr:choline BCCT transporter BetT [Nesterenkonia sp. GX14115]